MAISSISIYRKGTTFVELNLTIHHTKPQSSYRKDLITSSQLYLFMCHIVHVLFNS